MARKKLVDDSVVNTDEAPSLKVKRKAGSAEKKSSNLAATEKSGAWYKTGFGNTPPPLPKRDRTTWRFWIPYGVQRDIIFLDEDPFIIAEHGVKLNGKWGNFYTCLTGVDPAGCPLCEELKENPKACISRSYPPVSCLTVLDGSQWTDREGNVRQWGTRVLAAKQVPATLLSSKQKEYGTLIGAVWTTSRLSDKSPSTGDNIMFKEWILNPEEFNSYEDYYEALRETLGLETAPSRVDYIKELKPKSRKELESVVFGARNEAALDESLQTTTSTYSNLHYSD